MIGVDKTHLYQCRRIFGFTLNGSFSYAFQSRYNPRFSLHTNAIGVAFASDAPMDAINLHVYPL